MKLNNKGITLVEIIISVALISIVLVFLFTMLIQVNNENSDNEVKSSYLINQAAFIKQIEEDFLDYGLSSGDECTYSSIEKSSGETNDTKLYIPNIIDTPTKNENIKCLKFDYTSPEYSFAYLFLYKRKDGTAEKTILSYYRGDFKQSVELTDFDWIENSSYNIDVENIGVYYAFSLPIIGPDYNDYSINLSYAA